MEMRMAIQTDREHDQLYILFRKKGKTEGVVKKTLKLSKDLYIDLDAKGKLVGIDMLNASKVLGVKNIEKINLDVLVGVAEAAALLGVKKPNFIRDYVNQADFPKPVAELASGRIWQRRDLEKYRKQKARKSA